jgi:hypothetical protein
MRILDNRALVGFGVGAGVAVLCTVAGASFAQQPSPAAAPEAASPVLPAVAAKASAPPLIVAACANKKTGVVTIKAKKHKTCTKAETAIAFAASGTGPTGPPGPAGPSGALLLNADGSLTLQDGARFTSANGLYQLVVTDAGVGLKGPGGEISINGSTINQVKTGATP